MTIRTQHETTQAFVKSLVRDPGETSDPRRREVPWQPKEKVVQAIRELMFKVGLPAQGRAYVEACLAKGPSRKLQDRRGNVRSAFTSRKMDCQLLLESRTGELSNAVLLENGPEVIAFFAQPGEIQLEVKSADGVVRGTTLYHPDFLIVHSSLGFILRESKVLGELLKKAADNPYQWYQDEQGAWCRRAVAERLAPLGLNFEVVVNESLPQTLVENVRFLEDYFDDRCPPLGETVRAKIIRFISARRAVSFIEAMLDGGFTADELNKAIVESLVCIDWELDRAADTANWAAAGSVDTDLSFLSLLELYRTDVPERRMPARRVVEALDVVEHI